ncbi:hypothetical protein AAG906_012436 [Vitis piasezkii]
METIIGRFEPHVYRWIFHMSMLMRRIQLLDSRPGRKKTMLSGVQQNLVVLWLAAHKKEVSPYDLRTFNFITPICGQWGRILQINQCGKVETLQVEDYGEYVVLSTKCTPRLCPEILKGIADNERIDKFEVNGDRLKEAQHINRSLCSRDVISLARRVHMSLTGIVK